MEAAYYIKALDLHGSLVSVQVFGALWASALAVNMARLLFFSTWSRLAMQEARFARGSE